MLSGKVRAKKASDEKQSSVLTSWIPKDYPWWVKHGVMALAFTGTLLANPTPEMLRFARENASRTCPLMEYPNASVPRPPWHQLRWDTELRIPIRNATCGLDKPTTYVAEGMGECMVHTEMFDPSWMPSDVMGWRPSDRTVTFASKVWDCAKTGAAKMVSLNKYGQPRIPVRDDYSLIKKVFLLNANQTVNATLNTENEVFAQKSDSGYGFEYFKDFMSDVGSRVKNLAVKGYDTVTGWVVGEPVEDFGDAVGYKCVYRNKIPTMTIVDKTNKTLGYFDDTIPLFSQMCAIELKYGRECLQCMNKMMEFIEKELDSGGKTILAKRFEEKTSSEIFFDVSQALLSNLVGEDWVEPPTSDLDYYLHLGTAATECFKANPKLHKRLLEKNEWFKKMASERVDPSRMASELLKRYNENLRKWYTETRDDVKAYLREVFLPSLPVNVQYTLRLLYSYSIDPLLVIDSVYFISQSLPLYLRWGDHAWYWSKTHLQYAAPLLANITTYIFGFEQYGWLWWLVSGGVFAVVLGMVALLWKAILGPPLRVIYWFFKLFLRIHFHGAFPVVKGMVLAGAYAYGGFIAAGAQLAYFITLKLFMAFISFVTGKMKTATFSGLRSLKRWPTSRQTSTFIKTRNLIKSHVEAEAPAKKKAREYLESHTVTDCKAAIDEFLMFQEKNVKALLVNEDLMREYLGEIKKEKWTRKLQKLREQFIYAFFENENAT